MRQQHNAPENLNEPEQSRYKIAEDHSTKADHLAREKEANQICAPFWFTENNLGGIAIRGTYNRDLIQKIRNLKNQ